ncbi:MAG: DUF975 family protein [Clostridia bacterium]|nr:DUF975 family protein [Clostridia bacterium]
MLGNYQLRYNARQQLGGGIFQSAWLNMLCVCFISSLVSAACASTGIGVLLVFVATGALQYGLARVTTNCGRNRPWDIGQLFSAFSEGFGKTVILHLVQSIFLFLWTLLFFIPGMVKSYSYALTYYLQQEPENVHKEPTDLITESRNWMRGHKWQLFCLDFSFIGWYILGALCFGVGTLFVVPYHQMARANFYLDLRAERKGYYVQQELGVKDV